MDIFDSLPGYCKYITDDRRVLEGIFVEHKIRFTQPAALNDPLDCNPLLKVPSTEGEHATFDVNGIEMPTVNLWYYFQLIESHLNSFGILSLTKNPTSFDMWSKYANGHKGIVIELTSEMTKDASFLSKENKPYEIGSVRYVEHSMIDISDCLDAAGLISMPTFEQHLFFEKSLRWENEREYRMVRNLQDLGKPPEGIRTGIKRDRKTIYKSDLPLDLINTVTFGAYMSIEDKHWIIEHCKNSHIQFLQCMIMPMEKDDKGLAPRVGLVPLDDEKLRRKILEMDPQLFLMGDKEILDQKHVSLKRLDDLPYYQGFEHLVKLMNKNRMTKRENPDGTSGI